MTRRAFGVREALEPLGALLEFSNPVPWEVLASDGCRRILSALALEAPETVGGIVVVTSTWRPTAGANEFSYHHAAEAIDWRTGVDRPRSPGSVVAPSRIERIEISKAWAARVAARLGCEFDVIFGPPKHIDHGHAERDSLKAARVHFER